MKRFLFFSTVLVAIVMAGCSPEPRGPVEVLNKQYIDGQKPLEFAFTSKDGGKLSNHELNKDSAFKYTLVGDKLTVTVPAEKQGNKDFTLDLDRRGNDFVGSGFVLSEKVKEDEARIQQSRENGKKLAAQAERNSPKGAPSDRSAYVSYLAIGDDNNDWATWLAMSWNAKEQNEETRLGVLSRAWYSTNDSFARNDMKPRELQRIQAKLDETRKAEYVALVNNEREKSADFAVFLNDGYDFDKKGFKLLGNLCGSNSSYGVKSGAGYEFSEKTHPGFCLLPVVDETLARTIEELRNKQAIKIVATVYAKVAGVDSRNQITLVPIGVDYVVQKETYRPTKPEDVITTVSVWPYK